MELELRPMKRIDREYTLTSKELKKALNIKGTIKYINLCEGLSPLDIEEGKSHDTDTWTISTREDEKDIPSVQVIK